VCDPVLVVLGARAVDVWREARLDDVVVLANRDWETGMASSLRAGLEGLRGWPAPIDAALILLVDMPGMTPAAVARVAAHAGPGALAVATYDGVRGHPVLIGRDHWAGVVETATGDEGARRYLAAHEVTEIDCTGLADPIDLDEPPEGGTVAP
jgi:molybdenum cofactor cytidylyltransferase/nicotine blue oxidoreductase